MKFLITDPCYVIQDDAEWTKFCDASFDDTTPIETWDTPAGKLIRFSSTQGGDGSMSFGSQSIGVDSGTICIIEVADDFKLDGNYGVIVKDLDKANQVFDKAQTI